MRILLVHNFYQQPGGEGEVFHEEGALLEAFGHDVIRYTLHNDSVNGMGKVALAASTIWSRRSYQEIQTIIRRERPDVAHFHNTLPLISPSAYHAAASEHVPVVQTLHNYRLLCPGVLFVRDGKVCEDCLGKTVAWPAVAHGCYRGSRIATAGVTAMLAAHRALGTWTETVDLYIAVTDFVRRKYIEGGFPPDRIVTKPHFAHRVHADEAQRESFALFVGRLSEEKGVRTLLDAWNGLGDIPLKIVGDGPLAPLVSGASRQHQNIEWLGRLPASEVRGMMSRASVVIVPSECYETFGRVIVEAYAASTPVIAANIGALAELVLPERTGVTFRAGDADDLRTKITWAFRHPDTLRKMGKTAANEYEARYTPERNHELLTATYELAIQGNADKSISRESAASIPHLT